MREQTKHLHHAMSDSNVRFVKGIYMHWRGYRTLTSRYVAMQIIFALLCARGKEVYI